MSERIAYEELKPGDVIQEGDEWWPKDGTNKWQGYHRGMFGRHVLDASIARRPHNITALQSERDEAQAALKSAQRARDELQLQVDELREQQSPATPADQLSFYELTAKRIASLEDDLSQVRADRDKLQGLIDDLVEEPTARQVQDMLRTWATELDWSADCFGSEGRDQINSLQRILIAVMERIEGMINPEGTSADT